MYCDETIISIPKMSGLFKTLYAPFKRNGQGALSFTLFRGYLELLEPSDDEFTLGLANKRRILKYCKLDQFTL